MSDDELQNPESWTLLKKGSLCNTFYPDSLTFCRNFGNIAVIWKFEEESNKKLMVMSEVAGDKNECFVSFSDHLQITNVSHDEEEYKHALAESMSRATNFLPCSLENWSLELQRKRLEWRNPLYTPDPHEAHDTHNTQDAQETISKWISTTGFTSNRHLLMAGTREFEGKQETIMAVLPNPPPENGAFDQILLFRETPQGDDTQQSSWFS